jgi:hypothetical protein
MTRTHLIQILNNARRDLAVYVDVRLRIKERIDEVEGTPHYTELHDWAGTQAIMNVLTMIIVRLEGQIEDLRSNLEEMTETGLSLVKEETGHE